MLIVNAAFLNDNKNGYIHNLTSFPLLETSSLWTQSINLVSRKSISHSVFWPYGTCFILERGVHNMCEVLLLWFAVTLEADLTSKHVRTE